MASASECIGGPAGDHAAPHRWWTPVRVVLAVTCLALCLGMASKSPCVQESWGGGNARYAQMCYSDVPYLYVGRGFAERDVPYTDTGGRYQAMEYPVVIGYFAYGAAVLTQALDGWPDLGPRQAAPADRVYAAPGVGREMGLYFEVTAVLLAVFGLAAAWFLAGTHRRRPWDAMLFAAAPVLVLSWLINWDLIAVAASAGAMWAWSRGRPALSGVLVGLGVATKLYPLFLLGALLVVCLRRRQLRPFLVATGSAVAAWLVLNAPAMLYGFDQWKQFWILNEQRGADLGSLWLVWQQTGHPIDAGAINLASWIWFGAVCIAVLARPRWRDLLVWQAGEVLYFVAVWFYLGEFTASASSGQGDHAYWWAIVIRVAAEVWLMAMVVRDVLAPWRDPVRADGITDDPMEPTEELVEV